MPEENDRQGWKKKIQEVESIMADMTKKIDEITVSTKAILKGMQEAEAEIGEPLMPKGVYHGYDFSE